MSILKALLKDVPVEWKALSSFSTIGTGNSNRQDESENGEYPFYVRSKKILKSNTFQFDEIAIVIPGEGGIGEIFHYVEGKYALHQRAYRIKVENENISTKFLYYFMMENFKVYISSKIVGATASSIRKPMLEGFLFPIPYPNDPEKSLAIQQEIVRVLDGLSEQNKALTTALAQEIDQRKKQYEYYREELFRFEGKEVELKTLGDIGDVKMCKRIFKNETSDEGDIPFYKIGTFGKSANAYISYELYNDYRNRFSYPKKGDILISAAGTIGRTVVFDGEPSYFQDSNIIWIDNNEEMITNQFLCHFYTVAKWYVSGGGIIDRLYNDNVRKTKIPVPFPNDKNKSIQEQERIVRLLDQFDEATKNIVAQLEKEIELRNKHYEYYRNLLLSFPKGTN